MQVRYQTAPTALGVQPYHLRDPIQAPLTG